MIGGMDEERSADRTKMYLIAPFGIDVSSHFLAESLAILPRS
jgi:hypothetical protein